jgi:hypothetical protein
MNRQGDALRNETAAGRDDHLRSWFEYEVVVARSGHSAASVDCVDP